MKTILFLGGIIVFVFLSACSSDEGIIEAINKNGDLEMKVAEMERASNRDLFLEVTDIEDSRCPLGVVCSSAGKAVISINARMGEEILPFTLEISSTGVSLNSADTIYDHRVQLIDITPYPSEFVVHDDIKDYTVILSVVEL